MVRYQHDMDDLKHTRDELQQRAEFEQQLIGIVSHDLRNPLGDIGMGASLRVRTSGDEDLVVIEVQNDGLPISPEDAARLFEPFQRGKNTKTSPARSVGLGLYFSRQIVAAHGGTIAVRSTAAAGTIFTVRLPRQFTPDA